MKKIKEWLAIPIFLLIIIIAGVIVHLDFFPTVLSPKIKLEKRKIALEEALVVSFDRPVIRHKIETSFSINPSVAGRIDWEGNNLVYRPTSPWEPDSKFSVTLRGATRFAYGFDFQDSFSTESLPKIVEISPAKDALVHPKSDIAVKLDKGGENYRLEFKVTPDFPYDLNIDQERKEFHIAPKDRLAQNTRYQFVAYSSYHGKDGRNWYSKELTNFQFQTIDSPKLEKVLPSNEEKDIKEFTPIKVYFSKPMKKEIEKDFFEISPSVTGNFEWEADQKTLVFKPRKWSPNIKYAVKIKKGWPAEDDTYLEDEISSNFHSYTSSGTLAKTTASTEEAKFKEGRYVDINLSKQVLSIFENGSNQGNFRISSGKRGMNTPTGTFNIMNKRKRAWSNKYKLFMPYWMQFTNQGHGLHELPEWPSGYKEGANHLGVPVSHGCVRLGVGSAETVFHFVEVGTPIYIHY